MRFLITGASGWIGYELVSHLAPLYGKENLQLIISPKPSHEKEEKRREGLRREGYSVLEVDLLEEDLDTKTLAPFDILFHLAAFTATGTKNPRVHVNDLGTRRLLRGIGPLLSGKRVIYTGSIASLDRARPNNTPMTEDYPCHPRSLYGATKLEGEIILQQLAKKFNFEWTILRIPSAYGPGFRDAGMFGLILKGLQKKSLVTRLAWPGRTSLIHVSDIAKALVFLATDTCGHNEIYHIDSGENPTVDQLIQDIAANLGIKRHRITLPNFFWSLIRSIIWFPGILLLLPARLKDMVWRLSLITTDGFVFDGSKLKKVLPFPYSSLEEGIPTIYSFQNRGDGSARHLAV